MKRRENVDHNALLDAYFGVPFFREMHPDPESETRAGHRGTHVVKLWRCDRETCPGHTTSADLCE